MCVWTGVYLSFVTVHNLLEEMLNIYHLMLCSFHCTIEFWVSCRHKWVSQCRINWEREEDRHRSHDMAAARLEAGQAQFGPTPEKVHGFVQLAAVKLMEMQKAAAKSANRKAPFMDLCVVIIPKGVRTCLCVLGKLKLLLLLINSGFCWHQVRLSSFQNNREII